MKKILKTLLLPCALVLLMGADNQEARLDLKEGDEMVIRKSKSVAQWVIVK